MRVFPIALCTLAALAGCSEREVDEHAAFEESSDDDSHQSEIVKVEPPVSPGVQIPCKDLLDVDAVAEGMGEEISLEDRSSSKPDATSVCGLHRTGEKPSSAVQEKRAEETGKLGVLPGDELCTIEAHCSVPTSTEGLVDGCENSEDELNEDLGLPACVHRTQRGPEWAYTYRVYDEDTECVYRVLGGPSVTDEELVQRCTDTALTAIAPASLEGYDE